MSKTQSVVGERGLLFVVGAVQFVNILDFMMVMPLGPDFASALGVPTSTIGMVGGAYTASAALSGLVGSLFLDRFERRASLSWMMIGLALATALGGFSFDLPSLLLTRVLAGAFGGPATSLALAIVADCVPAERRGKALGAVMGAFSAASVLGVPAGLELARHFNFRAPFFAVGALGLAMAGAARQLLPELRGHLQQKVGEARESLSSPLVLLSLSNTALLMLGVFSVVPNLSAFVQFNLGYPREYLGILYLVGGVASFFTMRLAGSGVDRFGALPLVSLGTLLHVAALFCAFVEPALGVPVLVVFTTYMLSGSVRMVPLQTLSTRVPGPHTRARFMSAQSAVQHLASALGAFLSAFYLKAEPDGRLVGMDVIALGAIGLALCVPGIAFVIERSLRRRDRLRVLLESTPAS